MSPLGEGCFGCEVLKDPNKARGGIVITLPGNWALNHYSENSKNNFLGWLVLQPRCHRMDWSNLSQEEVKAIGENIERVSASLRRAWSHLFSDPLDDIERVYVVSFSETGHQHIHLIPRTKRMRQICNDAWKTPELYAKLPLEYQVVGSKNEQRVKQLMRCLNDLLSRSGK